VKASPTANFPLEIIWLPHYSCTFLTNGHIALFLTEVGNSWVGELGLGLVVVLWDLNLGLVVVSWEVSGGLL
jgi:hypothetical protein